MIKIFNREDLENVVYIELEKTKGILLVTIIMSLIVLLFSFTSPIFAKDIIRLSFIFCSGAMMLTWYKIINIPINKYFFFLSNTFFLVAICQLIRYMPIENYRIFNYDFKNFLYIFPKIAKATILAFNIYFVFRTNTKRIYIKYWFIIILIGIIAFLITLFNNNILIINNISLVISLLILLYGSIKYRSFKIIKDSKLSYIRIYKIFLLISVIVALIEGYIKKSIDISIFHEYIRLVAFFLFGGCILQKVLNNSYNMLFEDIYNRKIKLEKLNKEILCKNKDIERSQNQLIIRNQIFKNLFKNMPVPVILLNLKNGRILFTNTALLALVNSKSLKNIINKKITSIIDFDDESLFRSENNINFNKIYEAKVLNNEKIRSLEIQFIEIIKENEECMMIISDMTETIEINEIESRIESKKNQEKIRSDFLSSISHDLKVPISVICSAMQLENLLIEEKNFEQVKKYTSIARDNCMALITLTNNLIDNSRLSFNFLQASLEKCNIVEFIEDYTIRFIEYTKMNGLNLVFDTDEEEIYIDIDIHFMERVILNLISNSVKYTPNGGSLYIDIKNHSNFCEVRFKDTGVGMDRDFIDKAFDRYSIGENEKFARKKGTGIGLFVVKSLIELQGGKVKIESQVGCGTTIIMKFYKEHK